MVGDAPTIADLGLFAYVSVAPVEVPAAVSVWLDRVRERRRLMIAADLGRAALIASIPVAYALDTLQRELPDLALYGPMDPELRGGVVPFNVPDVHPHDVAQVLDRFGIAVRAGHHCTMPLHERLDLAATARASFNVYSTREDIDRLVDGLREVERVFRA